MNLFKIKTIHDDEINKLVILERFINPDYIIEAFEMPKEHNCIIRLSVGESYHEYKLGESLESFNDRITQFFYEIENE